MSCIGKILLVLQLALGALSIAGKALFGTLVGVFFFSCVSYFLLSRFSSAPPLSWIEFHHWFFALAGDMQAALVGSFVTAIGLFVAFNSGYEGYLKQAHVELKMKFAAELDALINEWCKQVNQIDFYAQYVCKFPTESKDSWDFTFRYQEIQKRLSQIEEAKAKVASLHLQLVGFGGTHALLLANLPGSRVEFDALVTTVGEVTQAQWFYVPSIPFTSAADLVRDANSFIDHVDFNTLKAYSELSAARQGMINGLTGSLRGKLLYPVLGQNVYLLKQFVLQASAFFEFRDKFADYRKSLKKAD